MEQLRIQLIDGRWTVNGRIYKEMSFLERELLDKAITGLSREIEYHKSLEDFNYNRKIADFTVNGHEIISPSR